MLHVSSTQHDPGPYATLSPATLLDLFEQESYYTRVDGSAGMLIYTEVRKEILKRLTSTRES